MPCLRSNILSKMFYSTYESDILRTARATTSRLIFSNHSKKLIASMCKHSGNTKTFCDTLAKFVKGVLKDFKSSFQFLHFCAIIN